MATVATVANHAAMATAVPVLPVNAWQVVIARWYLHHCLSEHQHHQHQYLFKIVDMVAQLAVARLLASVAL